MSRILLISTLQAIPSTILCYSLLVAGILVTPAQAFGVAILCWIYILFLGLL